MRRISAVIFTGLSLALMSNVSAQVKGRLFSTVEQRDALNELRDAYRLGDPVQKKSAEAPPAPPPVTINGIVLRGKKRHSAWINGSFVPGGESAGEGIRVETQRSAGGTVRIMLPNGSDTVRLKPGQKIDIVSGSLLDAYQRKSSEGAERVFANKATDAADSGASTSENGGLPEAAATR